MLLSCSQIEYYTYISEPTEKGDLMYWEIQLDPKDSIYHEYVYMDQPGIDEVKTIPKWGDVIIGKYSIIGDTLFFTHQDWDFEESDTSYYKSGRRTFNKFVLKDKMIIDFGFQNTDYYNSQKVFYKNKSKSFRKEEKKDSIIWMADSHEAIINGIWNGDYPGLDDPKPALDSAYFISPNFVKN